MITDVFLYGCTVSYSAADKQPDVTLLDTTCHWLCICVALSIMCICSFYL